jgi:beta-N-acetylhexosaminidase
MPVVASLLASILATGPVGPAAPAGPAAPVATAADRPALTDAQLVGQRMVFAYPGPTPPAALKRRIRAGEAAGVILFARNIASPAALGRTLARLQAIPRPASVDAPLLVLVDQEGGAVRRLPGAPAAGASATTTPAAAHAAGLGAGRNLRSVGANVDLAPVVDVAHRGSVLAHEGRTYGRSGATVSALAGAFAQGLGEAGVAATYKHFPGFGAAKQNTDDAPVRISTTLAGLRRVDLVPYERPPAAVKLVMLSTAVYPARDPRPAAFSRRWATLELRDRLHFDGVSITDDLQTPAVSRFGTPAQLAFLAARAGVDLPLFARDYTAGARAAVGLVRALRADRLSRTEAQAAATRVLALRRSLPG